MYRLRSMSGDSLICLGIFLLGIHARLASQRCRDMGWKPWLVLPFYALFLAVPISSFLTFPEFVEVALGWEPLWIASGIFLLCLAFLPSKTEADAPMGSWKMFAASVFSFPIFCILLLLLFQGRMPTA